MRIIIIAINIMIIIIWKFEEKMTLILIRKIYCMGMNRI